jgi:hypothetical protein
MFFRETEEGGGMVFFDWFPVDRNSFAGDAHQPEALSTQWDDPEGKVFGTAESFSGFESRKFGRSKDFGRSVLRYTRIFPVRSCPAGTAGRRSGNNAGTDSSRKKNPDRLVSFFVTNLVFWDL